MQYFGQNISATEDETRSGYVRYVQGYQPNVPARTMCRHGLYNSMVRAQTILEALEGVLIGMCTYLSYGYGLNRP